MSKNAKSETKRPSTEQLTLEQLQQASGGHGVNSPRPGRRAN
jgi:hypothetical protein